MSKATFVPAVTETRTVEVSPAKVTLELSIRDVQVLRAFLGQGACPASGKLHRVLTDLHADHDIPLVRVENAGGFPGLRIDPTDLVAE